MACEKCQRRAALIAVLAPVIARKPLTRQDLLKLLASSDEQLLRIAGVEEEPRNFLHRLEISPLSKRVPTALCPHDSQYPETLVRLDHAPAVLHATCTTERLRELLAAPVIALVGDRVPTDYARQMTFEIAHGLVAAGVTVIGACTGLEGIALGGALKHANGHCIGVIPTGVEQPHPKHDERLHRAILAQGAAISEFPPGFSGLHGWCSAAGTRIIAALVSVVVVVEAAERSPALFTAQLAGELGHEIAAVPGRVTDPGGTGIFGLLRNGASPVACAQDVLDLIPMVHTTVHRLQRLAA